MVKYFSSLNYSLANEDTRLEFELVRYFKSKNILSVCGSGSRALPLLHPDAQSLKVVDLVQIQLDLGRLRFELMKRLSLEDYKKFFGYAPFQVTDHCEWRKKILEESDISPELLDGFKSNEWSSLLYEGKWEKTFVFFSKIVRSVLGGHSHKMFLVTDLAQQREYFKKSFPWRRWNLLVKLIGNKALFNALLYKGDFVKKNVSDSYYEYYQKAFKHLFYHDLTVNSFFLQLLVRGRVLDSKGNLQEVNDTCFQDIKDSQAEVRFIQSDLLSAIKSCQNLDFISLSDVPSYFQGKIEREFLQDIKPHLKEGGIVVLRSYLRIPDVDRMGFIDLTKDFKSLIDSEKVQMYRIEILQKNVHPN